MVTEIILDFFGKDIGLKVMSLQRLNQIDYFDTVILLETFVRKVNYLLTFLFKTRRGRFILVLRHQFILLLFVEQCKQLLNFFRIVRGLYKFLGLQIQLIELFSLDK